MKKNTYSVKGPKGVTLIELTVVIAIILVLISVLFIGVTFYKESADKAACIVNANAYQKGVRAWQNINNKKVGTDSFVAADIVGAGKPLEAAPSCPGGGSYTIETDLQAVGTGSTDPRHLTCDITEHAPTNTEMAGW